MCIGYLIFEITAIKSKKCNCENIYIENNFNDSYIKEEIDKLEEYILKNILSIRILNSEIKSLNVTIEENNDEHKKILSKNIPSFTPYIKI